MEYTHTWAGAAARRSWTVNRLIICWTSKWSVAYFHEITPYIIGCNCRLGRVLEIFNKYSGLQPLDTLSSCQLSWCRHACTVKQLLVKWCDLSFQSFTIFISTYHAYVCLYWIKWILCGYAIRSGRHPSGSQRLGPTCSQPGGLLTSLWMSAWPNRVTTKYSYYMTLSSLDTAPVILHVAQKQDVQGTVSGFQKWWKFPLPIWAQNALHFFTWGQFWPLGIVVACVCVSVCVSITCLSTR